MIFRKAGSITLKDLKERTIRGGLVVIISQAVKFVLRMGSLVVLARLLTPNDFGLVGMVIAVTGVLAIFKDAGLSAITVQRATITEEQISTLFWLNMLVGLVLFGLSLVIAPVIVAFYRESRLFWVTAVLASGFVFSGGAAQHQALLQRQMRFTALAVIEVVSLSVSIAIAIAMAASGYGYWALVGTNVIPPLVFAILAWLMVAWVPGMPRRKVGARSMLHFGGMLSLNSLIVYFANNIDKVLLGRFCGAEALGIYGRGYQLINIPTENLNYAIGSVAFPALSRIQDDHERFKNYFLKGYSLVLALTLPVTIACALFADELIFVVLGPKWEDVIPIFRFLTPTVLTFALVTPLSWLPLARGQAGRLLKIGLVVAPIVIAGYAIGLRYGPNGVAFGYSATMTLLIVPVIAWAKHGTLISSGDIVQAVSRPFLSATVAAALAFGIQFLFGRSMSPFLRLGLGVGVLSGSYLWMLLYVMGQKAIYLDLLRVLRRRSSDGQDA
jgi:PST family polysaccharide transporter